MSMSDPARIQLFKQIDQQLHRLDEEELRGFCQLYYPKVYTNITSGMLRSHMERLLKESAEKAEGLSTLLNQLQTLKETSHLDPSEGLPPAILQKLRQLLLRCGKIDRSLFADDRIITWQHEVQFDGAQSTIINRLIDLFLNKYHTGYHNYALILLLEVIRDTYYSSGADACFIQLNETIKRLNIHYHGAESDSGGQFDTTPQNHYAQSEPAIQQTNIMKVPDQYSKYEEALKVLMQKLLQLESPVKENAVGKALNLEGQLRAIINNKYRLYGETTDTKAEFSEINSKLNILALEYLGITFNELVFR